jgi:SAM-dependent methyltransferase
MSEDSAAQNESRFLVIDENGQIFLDADSPPITDPNQIEEIYRNLKLTEHSVLETEYQDEVYIVESFDHPLQIIAVELKEKKIYLQSKQNHLFLADQTKWSVDEWDRFNGLTTSQAPFVLTPKAQDQLFNLVDSYDDEGFVAEGQYVETSPYFIDTQDIEKSNYWMNVYKTESNPRWNLNQPAEALKDMIQRIKLPKSRILVLGCGEGHDAALFAEAGHVVTAVDFSNEALSRGKEKYRDLQNLHFHEMNMFHIPTDWNQSFDVVVEHTCFCAIPPDQRSELVRLWRRMLHEEGQLLSVFFVMEKRAGPPYGATEWEIRKRLQDYFQFLFWGRWRQSLPQRQGLELFVLAKKKK